MAPHGGKGRFLPLHGCAVINAVGSAWIFRPALRLQRICFLLRWAMHLLANLPPEAGLYACLFGSLVFWIFCGSRQTAISVTSAIALVIGSSLGEITGGNTMRFGALAAGTALLVSLIAFIAWLAKAGVMVHFISESVMTGFKSGVALFLASTQLPKLFGFMALMEAFGETQASSSNT